MRTRSATVAGVLGFVTAVNAVGNAIINNNCNHDVYLWPVSVDESPSSPTIIKANGGKWSQQYKKCSTGGMSLKLSDTSDISQGITQFEYTLDTSTIWYDISNVNCLPFGTGLCPFQSTGMFLSSGSGCPTAKCAAGADTCHDAYTYPKDDWASLACQPSADTVLDLCSPGGGSSGGIIGKVTSLVGNLFGGGSSTSSSPSTTYQAPAPTTTTPTTPAYVAPTTPTTSAYVAPTTPTTSAYVAPTTPTTSAYVAPTTSSSTPSPSPSQNHPGGAYNDHGAVGIAAVPSSVSVPSVVPTPKSYKPKTQKPKTTLITTQAPASPNVAVVYETVTEMVATTTVVYQHKMAHKAKRDSTHPHARRHHHEA